MTKYRGGEFLHIFAQIFIPSTASQLLSVGSDKLRKASWGFVKATKVMRADRLKWFKSSPIFWKTFVQKYICKNKKYFELWKLKTG